MTVVFFSAWSVYGGSQKTVPPKIVWEYKAVSLYRSVIGDGTWEVMFEDGKNLGANFPNMMKKFTILGEEGWELTSNATISDAKLDGYEYHNSEGALLKTEPSYAGYTNEIYFYFKRPK